MFMYVICVLEVWSLQQSISIFVYCPWRIIRVVWCYQFMSHPFSLCSQLAKIQLTHPHRRFLCRHLILLLSTITTFFALHIVDKDVLNVLVTITDWPDYDSTRYIDFNWTIVEGIET